MQYKFGQDTLTFLEVIVSRGQIIDVECNKSAILNFSQPLLNLSENLVISNMHNKFQQDRW